MKNIIKKDFIVKVTGKPDVTITVTSDGRIYKMAEVYSNGHKPGEIYEMKQHYSKGYLKVTISKKEFFVHRLVAMAFLSNPNNYAEVNHKDENKANNDISNLEWCDHVYNSNYGTRIERQIKNSIKAEKPAGKYLLMLGKKLKDLTPEEFLAYKRIEYFNRKYDMDIFSNEKYKDLEYLERFKKQRQHNARAICKPCHDYLLSINKLSRSDLSKQERLIYNRIYDEYKKYNKDIFASGDYLMTNEEVYLQKCKRISVAKLAFYSK